MGWTSPKKDPQNILPLKLLIMSNVCYLYIGIQNIPILNSMAHKNERHLCLKRHSVTKHSQNVGLIMPKVTAGYEKFSRLIAFLGNFYKEVHSEHFLL